MTKRILKLLDEFVRIEHVQRAKNEHGIKNVLLGLGTEAFL